MYEWIMLSASLILIFLLTNLATYLLTKNWMFNLPISITYIVSGLIYILSMFVVQFFSISITHIFLIPILVVPLLITTNWIILISYFFKFKNTKKFSLLTLIQEYKKDSIRNIVFFSFAILAASIFLRDELLIMFIVIYIATSISIFISTLLLERFLHD